MIQVRRWLAMMVVLLVQACSETAPPPASALEGQPGGPYRMTLALDPPHPAAGEETRLTWHLTHTSDGTPVDALQVLHQRVVHNFIVNLDFSSFAHIHHEDFRTVSTEDLKHARFTLPYRFPSTGRYRVVSDFTHRNRNWIKQFDVVVGTPSASTTPVADFTRMRRVGDTLGSLSSSPPIPIAGYESELVLILTRDGRPVTDLALILGSEVHVALWREDGRHFGHTHSYTPHMASMLRAMHDTAKDDLSRGRMMADMMVMMMSMPPELVFHGPQIPVHYVFPEPGVYHLFLQCAPGGKPRVFHFALKVEPWHTGMQTRIDSIVTSNGRH